MSYCCAWEKDKVVYMIADTAVSSRENEIISPQNSLGEQQTRYGAYFVQEGLLKIYKLSANTAVAFATEDVDCALEMIQMLYDTQSLVAFDELLQVFENTYGTNTSTELILIHSWGQEQNKIYKFSNGRFCNEKFAEIGSGVSLKTLSEDVHGLIRTLSGLQVAENHYYLAAMTAIIQSYFYKNGYFKFGVGGIVTGVFLNDKLKFCRDMEYYFFDDDLREGKALSAIYRYNSFFSASDISGAQTAFLNVLSDLPIVEDSYKMKGITKSLHTKNAFYYVFYSTKYHVVCMLKVNGVLHNIHFSRYIRRDHGKTDYAYCFRDNFIDDFKRFDSSSERMPAFVELEVVPLAQYMRHEEMIKYCNPKDVAAHGIHAEQQFDFDFDVFEYQNFDKGLLLDIKKSIKSYHNIVLVDYGYFYEAVKEKYELYAPYYDFSLEDLDLSVVNQVFSSLVPYDDFEQYLFCIVRSDGIAHTISDYDMDRFWKKYPNTFFVNTDDFRGVLFHLLKNYYINDEFFHLDKFIIMKDDKGTMKLLEKILPDYNFGDRNPDVVLIRNMNGFTNMSGGLRYVVMDVLVATMMKLSYENMGLLEAIAYGEIPVAEEEILGLPFNR